MAGHPAPDRVRSAPMSLQPLTGRTYGPLPLRISHAKAEEYVAATGDDPSQWTEAAPPSFAAALLFAVAPALIGDPEVGSHTRVLVHSDQLFRWHGPLPRGADVVVTGSVARVRERSGLNFVSFDVGVKGAGGDPLLDSTSTFLMGASPAAEPGPDTGEPAVDAGSRVDPVPPLPSLDAGAVAPPFVRAASRLDLVRYASASGDFNPIHFDHEAARNAGLDGIVVHGLLMAAWLTQGAAAFGKATAPLVEMKLRFRAALRPAAEATIHSSIDAVEDGTCVVGQRLEHAGTDLVTARTVVRRG